MKNIKSELIQLMLISEVGAKYTTSEILDYLGMENTNSNAKLLKQAMNELEEYYVHKKINVTDEDGKRHTLRGYVVINTVCEVEEETVNVYEAEETTKKEFELLKPTIEEIKTLANDLLINLLYEPDLNEYLYLKVAIHDNFKYLNDFSNQF